MKKYFINESGAVGILFVLLLPLLLACLGGVIDYGRTTRIDIRLGNAADAAALAVTRAMADKAMSDSEVVTLAEQFFWANINNTGDFVKETFTVDVDQDSATVTINVAGYVPTEILQIIGFDSFPAGATATATYGTGPMEVSLVLDLSSSMNRDVDDLQDIVEDFVDDIIPDQNAADASRIALVPYSGSVNAGQYTQSASGQDREECLIERTGSEAFTDAAGNVDVMSSRNGSCPDSPVVALTSSTVDLHREIGNFRSDSGTAGHLGIQWAYYTLSPNWSPVFGQAAGVEYGVIPKIAVIMTDGEFNTYWSDRDRNASETDMSMDAAEALCANMRGSGIRIYTIYFGRPSGDSKRLMEDCASQDDDGNPLFIEAEDAGELRAAFASIGNELSDLRLSR